MKIELAGKVKVAVTIILFVIALGAGLLLENMRNNKFSVETISNSAEPAECTAASVAENENVSQDTMGEQECKPTENSTEKTVTSGEKININTADAETLTVINGIGESLAKRIIDYRTKYGPFESIEEIMNVSGIGEKKFEDMRDMICVE